MILSTDIPTVLSTLALLLIATFASICIRRLYFHPLSDFPGPRLWAASRIPYIISLLRGTLNNYMLELHENYGPVIRLAPNELSFATEEAWYDIYMHRKGHAETVKDTTWYMAPADMPPNIVTTPSIKTRARLRRLLSPSFNAQALHDQSPTLESYANKVIKKLTSLHSENTAHNVPTIINMLDWTNFYTMDIIADLTLGTPFHCLDDAAYHPWIQTLYLFFKGMIFAAAARHLPGGWWLLQVLMPQRIREQQKQHTEFANEKVKQRVELDTQRPDFVTPFLREMERAPEKMSLGEMQSSFGILLIAGSESPATTLVGCFYHLAGNSDIQERLYEELKGRFLSAERITVEGTKELEFLNAVLSESLRLCNPVPGGLPRIVPESGGMYAGHFVPGGTKVSIRPHVLTHSAAYFHAPHTFAPARWLPLSKRPPQFANDVLSASQPFSVGPTGCIGKNLAWAEMRLLVAKVVWSFRLELVEGKRFCWEELRMMMVVEKEDFWVGLVRRDRGATVE